MPLDDWNRLTRRALVGYNLTRDTGAARNYRSLQNVLVAPLQNVHVELADTAITAV